jgi:hypothetical protein
MAIANHGISHAAIQSVPSAAAEAGHQRSVSTTANADHPSQVTTRATASKLIHDNKLPCSLTDARNAGGGHGPTGPVTVYEVACSEGLGYIIFAPDRAGPTSQAQNCVISAEPVNGKPSFWTCRLPGNANPSAGLTSIVARSGHTCDVEKAHYLGSTRDKDIYEVLCKSGSDDVLEVAKSGRDAMLAPCIAFGRSSQIKCILSTPEESAAVLQRLVKSSGHACSLIGERYLGSAASRSDFYEVACNEGYGYMIELDHAGKVTLTDCKWASNIGSGCVLKHHATQP